MSFCHQCGSGLAPNASSCGVCGVDGQSFAAPPTPSATATAGCAHTAAFVGPRYDYYQQKWAILEEGNGKIAWNWAAFFLGAAWLLYRRMYRYAFCFLGLVLIGDLATVLFGLPDAASRGLSIGMGVVMGWHGNAIYLRHVQSRLQKIQSEHRPSDVERQLALQGGTDLKAAMALAIVTALLLALPSLFLDS